MVYARFSDTDILFYDQAPVYSNESNYVKRSIASWFYYVLFHERFVRISPVLGNPEEKQALPRSYYVPFIARSEVDPEKRQYFKNGNINIMMVGKFHHRRKNHLLLLEAIDELVDEYDIRVTLVGVLNDSTDPYYREILETIDTLGLHDTVTVKINMDYHDVQTEYRRHDLYVLPSENEPAAVSHLEAMSHGLSVICSTTCGTRCYVHEEENGFVFSSGNKAELVEAIQRIIFSRERVRQFGRRSLELVQENYSPERYYEHLHYISHDEFDSI